MPRVLAIETSCDETSAAVLSGSSQTPILEAHITLSHAHKTQPYGGIVPEIVAREHLQYLEPTLRQTLEHSRQTLDDIDLVAATCGPGLMGGLVIGATTAKTLALASHKPFLAINHLEGHALSPRLSSLTEKPPQDPPAFPYLLLLVSGGHCQLLLVHNPDAYQTLGQTRDDSTGECLDKSARLLQLPEASGAALEKAAQKGNPQRFAQEITTLPQPMRNAENCDFSFSGLKSALARALATRTLSEQQRLDGAAALQKAVFDSLSERSDKALRKIVAQKTKLTAFAVAGGVAANRTLRAQLQRIAEKHSLPFFCPRGELCTDNAAMIAYAALARFETATHSNTPLASSSSSSCEGRFGGHPLSFPVRPRWFLQAAGDAAKAYARASLNSRKAYGKTYGKAYDKRTKKECDNRAKRVRQKQAEES